MQLAGFSNPTEGYYAHIPPSVCNAWLRLTSTFSWLYSVRNSPVHDDVNCNDMPIPMGEFWYSDRSQIMSGPNVLFIGGGHNTSPVRETMVDGRYKPRKDELDVVIGDEVWVGASEIALRFVSVSQSLIVPAGIIVTDNVPPCAVVAGGPANVIKFRCPAATILRHEELLYAAEQRSHSDELRRMHVGANSPK